MACCDFLQLVFCPVLQAMRTSPEESKMCPQRCEGNMRRGGCERDDFSLVVLFSLKEFSRLKICITTFLPHCLSTKKVFICSPLFQRTEN